MTQQTEDISVALQRLAARALGMTGADIQRVVKEARAQARRQKRPLVLADLEAGIRRQRPVPSMERLRTVAVHEAGHVLVHHVLGLGSIAGVTIDDPSGRGYGSLGFEPTAVEHVTWIHDTLAMLLAGRAAEMLVFGLPGAGAGGSDDSDLARATSLAFALERTVGLGSEHPLLYRPHQNPTSVLDAQPQLAERVHEHLERAEKRAGDLILEYRPAFDALVEALVRAQALDGPEVVQILEKAGAKPQSEVIKTAGQ